MGELPVQPGAMTAVPPAIRYRVEQVLAELPAGDAPLEGAAAERLARLMEDGAPYLGADPALAEIGAWMLEPRHAPELRARGCGWLAMFPTAETARRLAAVALDAAAPPQVREAAIAALGRREVRALHPDTRWAPEAAQLADDALLQLADAAAAEGKLASARLPRALRGVTAEGLAAVLARAPGLWGEAIECFATPPLARVLLVSLDDIPPRHRLRAVRLVAATLGEEAAPLLIARAGGAEPEERLELLLLAVGTAGEAHLPRLEDALERAAVSPARRRLARERARWHLANPGVVPTVRGLRAARTMAVIAPEDRAARCAQAADDLGALAAFGRHPEPYVYGLWAWMARGAGDPARAGAVVAAHPAAQAIVRALSFEELARRGRVRQLAAAAHELGGLDEAALLLAIWGRPLAALELAAAARRHTPEILCARALACYRAGRPDLADRLLAEDLPPAEPVAAGPPPAFPGPHEEWLIARAPEARPALAALAGGRGAVIALARPAPPDAEPDATALAPIAAVERRLGRALGGASVLIAGELPAAARAALAGAVGAAGARLVAGPLPGLDFFVEGDACPPALIARLLREGARRLERDELGGR